MATNRYSGLVKRRSIVTLVLVALGSGLLAAPAAADDEGEDCSGQEAIVGPVCIEIGEILDGILDGVGAAAPDGCRCVAL